MNFESIETFLTTTLFGQIIISALGGGLLLLISSAYKSAIQSGKQLKNFGNDNKMKVEMMILNPRFLEISKFTAIIQLIVAMGFFTVSMMERDSFYQVISLMILAFYFLYVSIITVINCSKALERLGMDYIIENEEKFKGTIFDDLPDSEDN